MEAAKLMMMGSRGKLNVAVRFSDDDRRDQEVHARENPPLGNDSPDEPAIRHPGSEARSGANNGFDPVNQ
jgi:hypothetical protein